MIFWRVQETCLVLSPNSTLKGRYCFSDTRLSGIKYKTCSFLHCRQGQKPAFIPWKAWAEPHPRSERRPDSTRSPAPCRVGKQRLQHPFLSAHLPHRHERRRHPLAPHPIHQRTPDTFRPGTLLRRHRPT